MPSRVASCACGAIQLTCEGEPVRVSVCHCLDCQRRTGSAFGAQARFPADAVAVRGEPHTFDRVGDSGGTIHFRFCPKCGSTTHWEVDRLPGFIVVALGAFADRGFPAPTVAVYETRSHGWLSLAGVEHMD